MTTGGLNIKDVHPARFSIKLGVFKVDFQITGERSFRLQHQVLIVVDELRPGGK